MTHIVCDIAQVVTLLGLVLGQLINRQVCKLVNVLKGQLTILEQV